MKEITITPEYKKLQIDKVMITKLYFTLIFQILVNFMLNPNYCVCLDFNSNAEDIDKLPAAWMKDIISSNEWDQWEESNKNSNDCNKIKSKQSPIDLYETGDCKDRHKIFITVRLHHDFICTTQPITNCILERVMLN